MNTIRVNVLASGSGNEDKEIDPENLPKEPFTKEDLTPYYRQFVDFVEKEKFTALTALLANQSPEITEDFNLKLKIQNESQQEKILSIADDFLAELRKGVNNFSIQLRFELIAQEEIKRKVFTVEDKYRIMAEKNPNLIELRRRLGLDPIK